LERARLRGLIEGPAQVRLRRTTGLESHHISHYFLRRSRRTKRFRRYPRLTILCHNPTHLIAAALPGSGPGNESPGLPPVVRQGARRIAIKTLYADSAYDSEAHHRLCREELGMDRTIIPINDRGRPDAVPRTPYRAEMKERFPRAEAGQRWQVESVISRMKRRLGSALCGRTDASRAHESQVRVPTHNLMIL
jgi:hypothetical protein